jgi:hypothetical protein
MTFVADAIVWRRNLGGRRAAHAYVAHRPLCTWARPFDSPLSVETTVGPSGFPFGQICRYCESIVCRAMKAAGRVGGPKK